MKNESNGRTQEAAIREIRAQVQALKDSVENRFEANAHFLEERDKRYTDRDVASGKAIDAALKAADALNTEISQASEKATIKSDANAEKWRENANEWRGAMMDRETKFASREEMANEFKSVRIELQSLKESRAEKSGANHDLLAFKNESRANIAAVIAIISVMYVFLKMARVLP